MKNIFISILILIPLIFILSCEEIPLVLADPLIPESDKVVLIEELTGASCPNCPKGSAAIENILNKYPDKVAVVAIHGDFLASPIPNRSKYDFRNKKANDLENWFRPWYGKPAATTNRILTDDAQEPYTISSPDLWQAQVENELQKPHLLNLLMDIKYDSLTRKMEVEIAAIPLVELNGNYNISVYITESGITDAQTNGGVIVDNYVHNHVLREMLTKFDGDNIGNNLQKSSILKRNYTYTLPPESQGLWKASNIEVVAMVSRSSSSDRSVLQAVVKHLN